MVNSMLNIGLLGTGMISELFVRAANSIKGLKIIGVFNRDYNNALEFALKNDIELAFSSYEEMLLNERIDSIYVGLPNSLHYKYGIESLKAKKITIIEKPFLSNISEYLRLMEAAKASGTMVFEMNRVLQLPNFRVIKNHIVDIAPIRMISINYSQYSRRYDELLAGKIPNVFSDEFSGGALTDLGVYGIHFTVGLFGVPREVVYVAQLLPNTVDVGGVLVLKYDGFIANLIQSKNSKCDNRISIQGEKGTIYAFPIPSKLEKVELDILNKEDISLVQDLENMAYTLQDIVNIVDNNDLKSYEIRTSHTHVVMEVLEKARRSAGIVYKADSKTQ
jgi:predicted dehydrogenase